MAAEHTHSGFHAVFELLKSGEEIHGTLLVASRNAKARDAMRLARERGVRVEEVEPPELSRRAGEEVRHVAFIGSVKRRHAPRSVDEYLFGLDAEQATVLLLDGISDPQNYGAILRSACQFGVDLVVVPQRRSAPDSAAVSRASAGALALMNVVRETNLSNSIGALKSAGFWIYGADMSGTSVRGEQFAKRNALIVGSEGAGLGARIRELCDTIISIPTVGPLDSLNVSVSTAILLYELSAERTK